MTYVPVDVIVDQKSKQKHRIDALNLLAYSTLLIIVLLTTWFFKKRRRLYIHETGLAIIYGMLMGATLRYFGLEIVISSQTLDYEHPITAPVDYLIFKARTLADESNKTHVYAYEFKGELQAPSKLGSQISYAAVDPEVFFNLILPPIVLNAGLSLKRRHFFRNIGAIFTYAFIGTTISVAFVGGIIYGSIKLLKIWLGYSYLAEQFSLANCLYFGAIISPTDPLAVLAIFQELGVDVNLFALVFGESILNDAVSIVLTHSIDQFSIIYGRNPYYPLLSIVSKCVFNFINMLFTSCLIGIVYGVGTALTTKFSKLSDNPLLETSLIVLTSYSSFLTAEVADASGIVAILLCGITQAHYTINNLSFDSRERLRNLFEMMNFLCENFLFLAVGVSFWQRQTWNLPFVGIAFVACIIARAMSVYPLTAVLNLGRKNKISSSFGHVIAWGGAARGVISYSLAAKNTIGDAHRIMLSTTSVIVIVSVIVVGGSVDLMLKGLKIPTRASKEEDDMRAREHGGPELSETAAGNNPSWLIRTHRLKANTNLDTTATTTTTSMAHSPAAICSRKHSRQLKHSLVSSTPVVDIEQVWRVPPAITTTTIGHESGHQQQQQRATLTSGNLIEHLGPEQLSGSQSSATSSQVARAHEVAAASSRLPALAEAAATIRDQVQRVSIPARDERANSVESSLTDGDSSERLVQSGAHTSPYENASLVRRWRNLDNNFIKPLLTNSHPTLMDTLPESLQPFARLFTSDEQLARHRTSRE